jgi:hypothetical protein
MRLFKPNVKKMAAARDINGLANTLYDKEVEIRRAAIEALAEIGSQPAIEKLILRMKSEDALQTELDQALVDLGQKSVMALLESFGKGWSEDETRRILDILVRIGGQQCATGLAKRLEFSTRFPSLLENALVRLAPVSVYPLCNVVEHHDSRDAAQQARIAAAKILLKIADPSSASTLAYWSTSYDPELHRIARQALIKIGQPATGPLVEMLTNGTQQGRRIAAEILRSMDWQAEDERQRARLALVLEDWNELADKQLSTIAIDFLLSDFLAVDGDNMKAALEKLERIDPDWGKTEPAQRAIPVLVDLTKRRPKPMYYEHALKALKKVDPVLAETIEEEYIKKKNDLPPQETLLTTATSLAKQWPAEWKLLGEKIDALPMIDPDQAGKLAIHPIGILGSDAHFWTRPAHGRLEVMYIVGTTGRDFGVFVSRMRVENQPVPHLSFVYGVDFMGGWDEFKLLVARTGEKDEFYCVHFQSRTVLQEY